MQYLDAADKLIAGAEAAYNVYQRGSQLANRSQGVYNDIAGAISNVGGYYGKRSRVKAFPGFKDTDSRDYARVVRKSARSVSRRRGKLVGIKSQDGKDHVGYGGRRKRRKSKVTFKKVVRKVNRLAKEIPKQYFTRRHLLAYRFGDGATENSKTLYEIPVAMAADYEGTIDSMGVNTVTDFRTKNTAVRIRFFGEVLLKNNSNQACDIRYKTVICSSDGNQSYCDYLLLDYAKRGLTGLPTVSAAASGSATTAALARRVTFSGAQLTLPMMSSSHANKNFKVKTACVSMTLGPGDEVKIPIKHSRIYRVETSVVEGSPTYNGGDILLLLEVQGRLGHQPTTNTSLVGFSPHALDATLERKLTAVYYGDYGLKEMEIATNLDATNLNNPLQADDEKSNAAYSIV